MQCWGYNGYGQLGDGTAQDRPTPVTVGGLTSGVIAMAAGASHTCAATSDGVVWCWGDSSIRQLGTEGNYYGTGTRVPVSGFVDGVVALAAGYAHTCALRSGGDVHCWGNNYYGQTGFLRLLPSDATAVAAGSGHSCALTRAGEVRCWGFNGYGQIGNGTTAYASWDPATVTGLASRVVASAPAAITPVS